MNREENIARVKDRDRPWDMVIIGGGATGLGAAVDAASRGYDVALVEQSDFGKGTSSRSTKLIHGGVRYLQQGNIGLVREALRERSLLLHNAPHLVSALPFIIPSYRWWESTYYGAGIKAYDLLAGTHRLGRSRHLSRTETIGRLPTIRTQRPDRPLRGGTLYFDAQFDDARLTITLARTACGYGGVIVNYMPAVGFQKDNNGRLQAVVVRDLESGEEATLAAKTVINATGAFCDNVRQLDDANCQPVIAPSQGVHVVVDSAFLPGDAALLIPKTDDGRVLFAIPWHGVTVIGTTDTPIDQVTLEPQPFQQEVEFILETAGGYLDRPLSSAEIKSVFTGIRPLVKSSTETTTSKLARDHTILVNDKSGLITITGGKWTTFRKMAEDVVNRAAQLGQLAARECQTRTLRLHAATESVEGGALGVYGADADAIRQLMREDASLAQRVHADLPLSSAEVVWACRHEMARTIDDVLARRSRWLILDARAAIKAADAVALIMQGELHRDDEWRRQQRQEFLKIAGQHLWPPSV